MMQKRSINSDSTESSKRIQSYVINSEFSFKCKKNSFRSFTKKELHLHLKMNSELMTYNYILFELSMLSVRRDFDTNIFLFTYF